VTRALKAVKKDEKMKKVLFATTALVATAGVASADIALSGSAQMGIQGGAAFVTGCNPEPRHRQRTPPSSFRISTSPSRCPARPTTAPPSALRSTSTRTLAGVNQDDAGVAIFISGDLGTLTLGDTDGALDWAMQEVDFNGAASINDDHTTHAGFNGNGGLDGHYDGQILRYDYSFGDFSVALSVEQDDNTTAMGDALGVGLVQQLQASTVTRSGASVQSTPACSLAAPSASASVTSSPTTATRQPQPQARP
jgi:outer membrane protein OmpU